jgi:putative acetyltransferase
MNIKITRTNSFNPDFRALVSLLDKDLSERDGDEHSFFAQYNKLDNIEQVVVAYLDNIPVGCGAIKTYTADTAEIKRMFVDQEFRRKGIASMLLSELESWAKELGYRKCILETGERQPEAINLYEKIRYQRIPNYGQYSGIESSVCMIKHL